jgi:hypothetical protein
VLQVLPPRLGSAITICTHGVSCRHPAAYCTRVRGRRATHPAGAFVPATVLSGHDVLPAAQRTDIYLTALGIVLTLIYAVGLLVRPRRRILGLGVDTACLQSSGTEPVRGDELIRFRRGDALAGVELRLRFRR